MCTTIVILKKMSTTIFQRFYEIEWTNQVRRDRSDFWEGIKAHNATVTCAIFAPHPEAIIKPEFEEDVDIPSVNVR